jgi:hypothetical protein
MDCLRSFNFIAAGQSNWVAPDVKTWFVGAQEFWSFERNGSSTFTPQGFKNIDIYGISLIGNIGTLVAAPLGGAIPTDWSARISINGQLPQIGGVIDVTNDFNIDNSSPNANLFELGRFTSNVQFADPIKSVTSIVLNQVKSNGTGGQSSGNVNLLYFFNFVVYYKFEGE